MGLIPDLAEQYMVDVREREQDNNKAGVRQTEYRSEDRLDYQQSLQAFDVAVREPTSYEMSDVGCQQEIGCLVQIGQGHPETLRAIHVIESSRNVADQQTDDRCSDDPAREGSRGIERRAANRRDGVGDCTGHANLNKP